MKTIMKTFKIGVLKFMKNIPFNQEKIRKSFIWVEATDEVNAIQEYNEKYNNFKDVHTYLILGGGKMTEAIRK
jgi:GTP cyclohydrolase II